MLIATRIENDNTPQQLLLTATARLKMYGIFVRLNLSQNTMNTVTTGFFSEHDKYFEGICIPRLFIFRLNNGTRKYSPEKEWMILDDRWKQTGMMKDIYVQCR